MDASETLSGFPIVPVVVIENPAHAQPLARALLEGGISVIEVTLRSARALEAVERIAESVPDMLIGVGTVLEAAQISQAYNAGAQFAISPGHTAELVTTSQALQLPFVPGATTPSEILRLRDLGYRLLKLFPAESSGGAGMLLSLISPFPDIRFIPTGGIHPGNADHYLRLSNVSGIGGSWIAPLDLLKKKDFVEIRRRASTAVELAEMAKKS